MLRTRQIHSIRVGDRYYIYCIWLLLYLTFKVISIALKIECYLEKKISSYERVCIVIDISKESMSTCCSYFKYIFNVPIFHTP